MGKPNLVSVLVTKLINAINSQREWSKRNMPAVSHARLLSQTFAETVGRFSMSLSHLQIGELSDDAASLVKSEMLRAISCSNGGLQMRQDHGDCWISRCSRTR